MQHVLCCHIYVLCCHIGKLWKCYWKLHPISSGSRNTYVSVNIIQMYLHMHINKPIDFERANISVFMPLGCFFHCILMPLSAFDECSQVVWYTEKTIFPFPFKLTGIWSWWTFSFRFSVPNWIPFGSKNRKENFHHDHIPFNVKGNGNIVSSV